MRTREAGLFSRGPRTWPERRLGAGFFGRLRLACSPSARQPCSHGMAAGSWGRCFTRRLLRGAAPPAQNDCHSDLETTAAALCRPSPRFRDFCSLTPGAHASVPLLLALRRTTNRFDGPPWITLPHQRNARLGCTDPTICSAV